MLACVSYSTHVESSSITSSTVSLAIRDCEYSFNVRGLVCQEGERLDLLHDGLRAVPFRCRCAAVRQWQDAMLYRKRDNHTDWRLEVDCMQGSLESLSSESYVVKLLGKHGL